MNFKAVIFDMDGVLIDDFEPWIAFDKNFWAPFNIVLDDEFLIFANGRSQEEAVGWVKEKYKLPQTLSELITLRHEHLKYIYEVEAKPMAGAEALLKKIKESGLKLALASGAKLWMVETILDRFNWRQYFEVVVSADHVEYKGKPDPEIYLHTARLLKMKPEECLVFEDAENGVAAAKQAGMKCIGYKDLRFDLPDNLLRADLIVNNLRDKRINDFLNI